MADHRAGQVGVEVERHPDGHRGPDHLAHGVEQVALAVLEPLGHHRPVQVEQHAVQAPGRAEVGEQPRPDLGVDGGRHAPGGRRGGRHRGQQRHAVRGGGGEHPAEAGAGAAVGLEDLAAPAQVPRLELAPAGRQRAERVRLVREHRDEDAHHSSVVPGRSGG